VDACMLYGEHAASSFTYFLGGFLPPAGFFVPQGM
jgi:hypothetical protein